MRTIPGVTQEKLKTLCANHSALESLIEAGLQPEDIAASDENRLSYVLANFKDANIALKFVDVRELLGLGAQEVKTNRNTFASASTSTTEQEVGSSSCTIV